MEKSIFKLQEELSKFGGYRFPEDIRNIITEYISSDKNNIEKVPISSKNSPILLAFQSVATNPKTIKLCSSVINSCCDAVLTECFISEAFILILNTLSLYSKLAEADTALKLLQFYSSLLPKHFTQIQILQILFSASLSLVTHPAEIVSSAAFASSQQMISHFFNYITSSIPKLSQNDLQAIKTAINLDFSRPLFNIGYLILYDISAQIFDKPLIWLKLPKLPIPLLFRLWELITTSHHTIIESESLMLDIVESSAVMPIVHTSEISFLVSLNTRYLQSLPSTSIALFSYFLQCCNQYNNQCYISLLYFRSVFFGSRSFVSNFCQYCDPNGSLFDALLEALDRIADNFAKTPVRLTMMPMKIPDNIDMSDKKLWETAPFEICLSLINSLSALSFLPPKAAKYSSSDSLISKADPSVQNSDSEKAVVKPKSVRHYSTTNAVIHSKLHGGVDYDDNDNESSGIYNQANNYFDYETIKSMVNLIWPRLLALLVKATRYADEESIPFIFDGFSQTLNIFLTNSVQEGRALVLRILCGLAAKKRIAKEEPIPIEIASNLLLHKNKKGLFFKKKHEMAYNLLVSLLSSKPRLFTKLFLRLFMTFSAVPENRIDPTFSVRLENPEVAKLCSSVIKGNNYCISFVSSVLVANKLRFDSLFKAIQAPLLKQMESVSTRNAAYSLLVECLTKCFTETSEMTLLTVVSDLLSNKEYNITSKYRVLLLTELKALVMNSSIRSGWPYVLQSIQFFDEASIPISFNILNALCNDQFTKLSSLSLVDKLIKTIFDYVSQKFDINISLSSLTLEWVVIPFVKTDAARWRQILSETIIIFSDERKDVAISSVRTFFSILSTNASQLPKGIFLHLIENCFVAQLMAMAQFPESMWGVQQLILQEMCHCAVSFWGDFAEAYPQFTANFWELIVGKQEMLMASCRDQEINLSAFQFYEECFGVPQFTPRAREFLTDSFASVVRDFLRREPQSSLVLSCLGRIVNKIFLSQKRYLCPKTLSTWLAIVSDMCRLLASEVYINISTEKAIEGLYSILPLVTTTTKAEGVANSAASDTISKADKIKAVDKIPEQMSQKTKNNPSNNLTGKMIDNTTNEMKDKAGNKITDGVADKEAEEKIEMTTMIERAMIKMIIENEVECVRTELVKFFIKTLGYDVDRPQTFIDCRPLYSMSDAESVLIYLLSEDLNSNNIEVFQCYNDLMKEKIQSQQQQQLKQQQSQQQPQQQQQSQSQQQQQSQSQQQQQSQSQQQQQSQSQQQQQSQLPVKIDIISLIKKKQIGFIQYNSKKLIVLKQLWYKFCDQLSSDYSQSVSDTCFNEILIAIRKLLNGFSKNEKVLLAILKFIEKVNSPKMIKNAEENVLVGDLKWHINSLMTELSPLINDQRERVSKQAKRTISLANKNLK